MQVNNLSDPVEGDKLKSRFYGDTADVGSSYRPTGALAQRAGSDVQADSATGGRDEGMRALWRDRLFDRQTELLQRHVEFAQRQQTELVQAIQAACSAKEAEVGLDREILLKVLEAKSSESLHQTKTIIDKLNANQVASSSSSVEIDTIIQPVKSELKALQFQLDRLSQKHMFSETAPIPAHSQFVHDSFHKTTDLSFYAKLRAEMADISAQLANCTWTSRKPRRIEAPKPPADFVLRTFGQSKPLSVSPKAVSKGVKTLQTAKQPMTPKSTPTATARAKATAVRPAVSAAPRVSPDKPRLPPRATPLTASPLQRGGALVNRFDMQTSTEGLSAVMAPTMSRHPQDFIAIDDLYIDIPNFGRRQSTHSIKVAQGISPSATLPRSANLVQTTATVLSKSATLKIADSSKTVIAASPSPARAPVEEEVVYSSVSDGRSVGELSRSSGEVSNSVSYW